jgi:putative ABC transport system substrate-binding protein
LREAEVAARSLKVQLQALGARAPGDFAGAFSAMTKERAHGLIVLGGSMFFAERSRIVELAAQSRVPAIYGAKEYAEAGGLMAYAPNLRELPRPPPRGQDPERREAATCRSSGPPSSSW